MPTVCRLVEEERAHSIALYMTKHKLFRCIDPTTSVQKSILKTRVFDSDFANPIGIAAGFDKNSDAVSGIIHYGVGFTEIGTVTPLAQDGNPKKRIFRIIEDRALINRLGFNNKGMNYVKDNLSKHTTFKPMIVGLNIGKNKDTRDISSDFLKGLEAAKDLNNIDYLVVNISSPNTPGLRDTQHKENLQLLLNHVVAKMDELSIEKPLLVKIAPDITISEIKDIAEVVMEKNKSGKKISGLILTNTTISRPEPNENSTIKGTSNLYQETGGLSGRPLNDMSTKVIGQFYKITNGQIPIIGVGGVSSGKDAYEKIKAGASLIQLYTALVYEGPPIVNRIKLELAELLEKDGFTSVSQAVGLNHKESTKS